MQYCLVNTAVTVFVNSVPLTDDTDFKSRETTVAYDAAGMDLVWNFETVAGVITQTAVTPTTAGDYDWTHVGDAMYKIEIPASGGGSINNDTEGYGFFSGVATGVLPWRGPTYCFAPANVVNSLVPGSDLLQTDLTQIGGAAQSATDLKDFADDGYDPAANKVQGVVLVDTTTTNSDMRGTDSAALASVCTEARLAELDAANLPTTTDAIETDTQNIQNRIPDALVSGNLKSDALAINSNTAAATRLALSANQVIPGTVDTATNGHTPTTTEFQADDITEATADHFNGRVVIFTSGALAGQASDITDYAAVGGIGQFTVTAMTEAPANNDAFVIV